jgi:enoyl-CoA hydratase
MEGIAAMPYETIILEKNGVIGKLTFNRPESLNAYSKTLSDEMTAGINELARDESVRVIVLTGAGRAFMAGADINMVNEWSKMGDKAADALAKMFQTTLLEDCPKPSIAAVNGLAFGMGCEVSMACDFRIAVESAKFGQPEIKIGAIPGAGGTQRLLRLVGATKALEMITTGDPIDAHEAYRIGLVNKVVPNDKLWEEVEAFAGRLADKPQVALRTCKRLIYEGGDMPLKQALKFEVKCFAEVVTTEDAQEGTRAFLEKRKPQFKGR